MNQNSYHEEEKFSEVIKLLKDLPEVKAPTDFEYRVMVKVENKQFGDLSDKKRKIPLFWKLSPAALAVSAVLLFFVFEGQLQDYDNPLMSEPAVREEVVAEDIPAEFKNSPEILQEQNENRTPSTRSSQLAGNISPETNYRIVYEPNDVVTTEKVELPFNTSNNVDLDSYFNGSSGQRNSRSGARLVSSGSAARPFQFEGFLFRDVEDSVFQQMQRDRLDSLKKWNEQIQEQMRNSRNNQ